MDTAWGEAGRPGTARTRPDHRTAPEGLQRQGLGLCTARGCTYVGHGEGQAGKNDGKPLPPGVEGDSSGEAVYRKAKLRFLRRNSVAKLYSMENSEIQTHTIILWRSLHISYTNFA